MEGLAEFFPVTDDVDPLVEVPPGPLPGAAGALSAFPKPMRTVCPLGIPMLPPRRLSTSSLARTASDFSTKLTKPHSCGFMRKGSAMKIFKFHLLRQEP